MEDIKVLSQTVKYDKDAWTKTPDPDFYDICMKARVPQSWYSYQKVLNGKFGSSVIKPLSYYNSVLVPPPKLISISSNTVTLRYYTFADMYVINEGEQGGFYNVDRPWIRQYYPTATNLPVPEDAWETSYKFYTPWFLDTRAEVRYSQVTDEFSPFYIHETVDGWQPVPTFVDFAYPHFVPFNFKKIGPHMKADDYGVIELGSPMFDMTFTADDIIVERVKEFYATD